MKKSTKKVVSRLRRYIGHDIIRTGRTFKIGDGSYTDEPLHLLGFTPDGRMIVQPYSETCNSKALPLYFTDNKWITYKKALRAKNNALNKWRGKKIKRVVPTIMGDKSFMGSKLSKIAPTLISASKHHMVIVDEHCGKFILGCDYASPDEWILADE